MQTQLPPTDLYLSQARASRDKTYCVEIYEKWAQTYNDEVANEAQDYVAPVLVARAALNSTPNPPSQTAILDAGCGTGLVGQALSIAGVKAIDGLDLSPAMLTVAKKTGVYRDLDKGDLTRAIDKADGTYDVVVCMGTFTLGHVGPDPALGELVRVVKRKGVVIATVLEEIWEEGGFKGVVERLEAEGRVAIAAEEVIDYVKGHSDKAVMVTLEKVD